MDRQRAGGAVLFLAVAGLLLVAIFSRGNVKGHPAIEAAEPAPTIGSCLSRPYPDAGGGDAVLLLGGCHEAKFGEVYAVVDPSTVPPGGSCGRELAASYLGPTRGSVPGSMTTWTPALQMGLSVAVPDRKQRAAGQQWVACVISPLTADGPYRGSIRDVMLGAAVPPAFGQCSNTTQTRFPRPLPCSSEHNTETFARVAVTGPGPDIQILRSECRDLISAQTGLPDVTVDGALVVETVYFRHDTKGSRVVAPPLSPGVHAEAYCLLSVVGSGSLNASLLGVGTGALPWV